MPKKFKGENSKAVVARERKAAIRAEEQAQKEKALEDEYWKDDDKHVQRKQQRKDDKERKRIEQLERKKEQDALLEEEMAAIKSGKPPATKITRAEIELCKQRKADTEQASQGRDDEEPLEENLNRTLNMDGDQARSVEEAISVLGGSDDPAADMHPEKRMKAAYKAYEDKHLPILKAENSNMRLSQLKQMLKKNWMKSPENPMVQHHMAMLGKGT